MRRGIGQNGIQDSRIPPQRIDALIVLLGAPVGQAVTMPTTEVAAARRKAELAHAPVASSAVHD
jgi:hypothetical protein